MKANYQIGDWVFNTHNKKAERVAELRENGAMLDYNDIYPYDEIEPIPLTAEILLKNGFEQKVGHFVLSDDYYDVDVCEFSDSIWVISYNATEMNMPFEQWTISYLYELQQFVRHCGIDKQIKID